MLLAYLLLNALAADLWLYAMVSLRGRTWRRPLGLAAALLVATLGLAPVMLLSTAPLYLCWALAALACRRRFGPAFAAVFTTCLALTTTVVFGLLEPSYGFVRPVPASWYFAPLAPLVPALRSFAPAAAALESERIVVLAYSYLPSVVAGAVPMLGLLVTHRWRDPRGASSAWFGRPTTVLALGLLALSALDLPLAPRTAELWLADPWLFDGVDPSATLARTFVAHGHVAAWVYFALLPLAVLGKRALWIALALGLALGPAVLHALAALGLALGVLGWPRAPLERASLTLRPLTPAPAYLRFGFGLAAVLFVVVLGFYRPFGAGPWQQPASMRATVGPSPCAEAVGVRRFAGFEMACRESSSEAGMTPADAEAACTRAGMRVCTEEEWTAACQGPDGHDYPTPAGHGPKSPPDADCPMLNAASPPDACVPASGVPGLLGSRFEWVRRSSGGHVLKDAGPRYNKGIFTRCELHLSLAEPTELLDLRFLGTRCCRATRGPR